MAGLIGKRVKLFFDDTGKVLCKEGVIVSEGETFVEIKTYRGLEGIPTIKIVRCEVFE